MANSTQQPTFIVRLSMLLKDTFMPDNIVLCYKNGKSQPPSGFTAYNIKSFDAQPVVDLLKECGPVGYICILEDKETSSIDPTTNQPKVELVDGVMVPKTRPPHIYIGQGGTDISDLENLFSHLD